MLYQTVVTTTGTHGTLRAQAAGDPLKYGAVVVIKTTNQTLIDGVGNACGFQQFAQAREVLARVVIKIVAQCRRVVEQRLYFRVFGVENAQRIGVHTTLAVFVQFLFV